MPALFSDFGQTGQPGVNAHGEASAASDLPAKADEACPDRAGFESLLRGPLLYHPAGAVHGSIHAAELQQQQQPAAQAPQPGQQGLPEAAGKPQVHEVVSHAAVGMAMPHDTQLQQAVLDTPRSPASPTNVAHILAGLVSPEALHRHAPGTGAMSPLVGQGVLKPRTGPGGLAGSPASRDVSRGNSAGPGQSRLDMLLGIAPQAQDSQEMMHQQTATKGVNTSEGTEAMHDLSRLPQQPMATDGTNHASGMVPDPFRPGNAHGMQSIGNDHKNRDLDAIVQPDPGKSIPDAHQTEEAESDAYRVSNGQAHALSNAHPAVEPDPEQAFSAARGTAGEQTRPSEPPEQQRVALMPADPMPSELARCGQPFISMAAAGSFNSFQIASGGQAQWRHLISGKQVRSRMDLLPIRPCLLDSFSSMH